MANGEEDFLEKNKDRLKPAPEKRYKGWSRRLGREDSEMLLEKATAWNGYKRDRKYDDES